MLPNIREPFRLPKLLASEGLVLLSIAALGVAMMRSRERVSWAWLRHPAILLTAPLLLVASSSLVTSGHREHVQEALFSLWLGAVALIAWSLGLERCRLALNWLLPPAIVLSVVAALQYHGWLEQFSRLDGGAARLGVTSLAGAVGDLGSYLVLPCLLAQYVLWRYFRLRRLETGRHGNQGDSENPRDDSFRLDRPWVLPAAILTLLLGCYGLFISQTLTAIIALVVASGLFWSCLLPRRTAILALAAVIVATVLGVLIVDPLSERIEKVRALNSSRGLNAALSGRLDGWRAGIWMLAEHPLVGVGHGAYITRFADAKLALVEEGVPMFEGHNNPIFSNAHNEFIEVAAELGLPGLAVVGWMIGFLLHRCLRKFRESSTHEAGAALSERGEASFAIAAGVSVFVLAMGYFPMRIALTAFPIILVASWICSQEFLPGPESEVRA
jgi:O-antigen ligase